MKQEDVTSSQSDDSTFSTNSHSNSEHDVAEVNSDASGNEPDEDEIVKAIKRQKEKQPEHPPDIQCEDFVVDISFHPEQDMIAAGSVTGDVLLYKYHVDSTQLLATWELHTKACRYIHFNQDGSLLFSSSTDKSIMISDVGSGKLAGAYDDAHESSVYSLLIVDRNMFTSGDETGTVKLWDRRKKNAVFSLKEMVDYVSQMVTTESRRHLVCCSGDGTLTAINLFTHRLHMQSDVYDADLTSLALLRNNTKLVVSSIKGSLFLFNWGQFGYHSDEYPASKYCINSIISISDNIVLHACDDGTLRATHMFPHRPLGIVGQHLFSVECLDISNTGEYVASSSHDQLIKFWNIKYFEDIEVNAKEKSNKKDKMKHNLPSSKAKNYLDFFSGIV